MGFVATLERRCQQAIASNFVLCLVVYILTIVAYREEFSVPREVITIVDTDREIISFLVRRTSFDDVLGAFFGGQDIAFGLIGRFLLVGMSWAIIVLLMIWATRFVTPLARANPVATTVCGMILVAIFGVRYIVALVF